MRFSELSGLLQNRGYKIGIIEAAIEKARKIDRKQAIKWVVEPQTTKRVFREPPLLAYRRQKSLKDLCIRGKVPQIQPMYQKTKIKRHEKVHKAMSYMPICFGR